jgi:hypothetical protein
LGFSTQQQGHQAAVAHQLECFAYIAMQFFVSLRFEQKEKLDQSLML